MAHMTTCDKCGKSESLERITRIDKERYCRSCINALPQRLAAAEAAARWCYHILVDNQDLSHFYTTDQWPWLADEAKGGRDE